MSAYRTYYDYRKNYATNTPSSTSTVQKKDPSSNTTEKKETSKYGTNSVSTSSYNRLLPSKARDKSESRSESTSSAKITQEIRDKYGPGSYSPRTDNSNYTTSSTGRLSRKSESSGLLSPTSSTSSFRSTSRAQSRETSPVPSHKLEKHSYPPVSYNPYRVYSGRLSSSKDSLNAITNSTASQSLSRRNSREDLSRIGTSYSSNTGSNLHSKYGLGSSGSTSRRGSREDLSRIGTLLTSSITPASKYSTTSNMSSSSSRRGSREDLSRVGTSLTRYGSTSLSKYSTLPAKTDKVGSYSRKSPVPSISSPKSSTVNHSYDINKTIRPSSTVDDNKNHNRSVSTIKSSPQSSKSSEELARNETKDKSTKKKELTRTGTKNDESSTNEATSTLPAKITTDDVVKVTVITRGTSPNPPSSSTYLRTKRSETARQYQRDIVRPTVRPEMIDKEVQSDRMDDTARYSRFGSTRISPAPWSSYLDLKFSSPVTGYSKYSRSGYTSKSSDSPSKSTSYSTSKSDDVKIEENNNELKRADSNKELIDDATKKAKPKNSIKKNSSSTSLSKNSESVASKTNSKPKTNDSNKTNEESSTNRPPSGSKSSISPVKIVSSPSNSLHSLDSINKDFRKSVLNMNLTSKTQKNSKSSTSSSDSESTNSTASKKFNNSVNDLDDTSVSESLRSKSASSFVSPKVVNKVIDKSLIKKSPSPARSRSASTDSTSSSSTTTNATKSEKIIKSNSATIPRCDKNEDLSEKSQSKSEKSVSRTSQGISEITNDSSKSNSCLPNSSEKNKINKLKKFSIRPIESGERAWWLKENSETSDNKINSSLKSSKSVDSPQQREEGSDNVKKKKSICSTDSGDRARWLTGETKENSEVEKKNSINIEKSNSISDPKLNKCKIKPVESGERAWWLNDSSNSLKNSIKSSASKSKLASLSTSSKKENKHNKSDSLGKLQVPKFITHQMSGEKAWWLMSNKNVPEGVEVLPSSEEDDNSSSSDEELENYIMTDKNQRNKVDIPIIEPPLGDRLSPDGIETAGEDELYTRRIHNSQFVSKHTDIDDILNASPVKESTKKPRNDAVSGIAYNKLDDSALQLYKDGDYGAYLDLEASISEQQEELEGFQDSRKNAIILRTQLSVRVHSIIEKLMNSEGRDLRRALFSLKQIFQEDKDLVHEFVQNDGLSCLIKVGSVVDQNYQNYILRALGQLMLYVDGMNGVMEHNLTVQWLYTLIASKFRLVVKTALKLLLVFVEYVESNCLLLISAINAVDSSNGLPLWSIIMRLLKDYDNADTELLIYATTLINKCFNGIPDQDTYYDQVDALEEQGMEGIIQRYMSRQGTDLDLLRQFQIYEAVLEHEDGEQKDSPLRQLDEAIRQSLRNRKAIPIATCERRKSRRHSTGTSSIIVKSNNLKNSAPFQERSDGEEESSSSQSSHEVEHLNGTYNNEKDANHAGVTPALRRRRERAERQRSFIREQQENAAAFSFTGNGNKYQPDIQRNNSNGTYIIKPSGSRNNFSSQLSSEKSEQPDDIQETNSNNILKKPWMLSMMYSKSNDENCPPSPDNEIVDKYENGTESGRNQLIQLNKENSVKDLTQKLSNQNILHSPVEESRPSLNRIGDMSGLIFKAKEGLAKSKSKIDVLRSPTGDNVPKFVVPEIKKTESELHWEELLKTMDRPLNICDLDFTDLQSGDERDILAPSTVSHIGPPPPPPPSGISAPPTAPPTCPKPPIFGNNLKCPLKNDTLSTKNSANSTLSKKNKKTVKLFWKEVRDDPIAAIKLQQNDGGQMIWDEINPVSIDTQKLEHLFESRAKDLLTKKQQELNKNKEVIVLDHKRSNAINIGMTKLPPPRSIKTAILKMDATIMNREGIEKLLTMLPTEEERTRIQDAQAANPDLPLGSAEQFLLTLASISELPARLKLWAFKLDFESSEREIAEPLMDLKQGIEVLRNNKTFKGILSTLLSIGIFLNGSDVKGFQIDYLAKVPEVKDTVHKHSLLHHLCFIVMEKFPDSTDLYSEIGAITRVSKVDFDELKHNIQRLETDCKASWDHLKLIAKHDGTTTKVKMTDFLADCAERIILLSIIHRRVINRYRKFLMWLGVPLHQVGDTKPNEFCKIISEFALEYRTTRERVLQQLEKKANHRERNKTRGKMITEVGKFSTKEEHRADAELRHVLGTSDISDVEGGGTLTWRRRHRDQASRPSIVAAMNGGDITDADDEILESLVKTATKAPTTRTTPRERKRTRHVDRKSIKRSRTRESMLGGSKESP